MRVFAGFTHYTLKTGLTDSEVVTLFLGYFITMPITAFFLKIRDSPFFLLRVHHRGSTVGAQGGNRMSKKRFDWFIISFTSFLQVSLVYNSFHWLITDFWPRFY